jgi:hypothetical protein
VPVNALRAVRWQTLPADGGHAASDVMDQRSPSPGSITNVSAGGKLLAGERGDVSPVSYDEQFPLCPLCHALITAEPCCFNSSR